jgi:hypothetical protein
MLRQHSTSGLDQRSLSQLESRLRNVSTWWASATTGPVGFAAASEAMLLAATEEMAGMAG